MDHSDCRKRVCAVCLCRLSRKDLRKKRFVDLSTSEKYLKLVKTNLPELDVSNLQHPVVICDRCSCALRVKLTKKIQRHLKKAKEFFSKCKRRSPRNFDTRHNDCEICELANSGVEGCCGVPVKSSATSSSKRQSQTSSENTPSVPFVSNSDLKRIQTEFSLSQRTILGIARSFRYATKGVLQVEPGAKEYLAAENEIYTDLFDVSFATHHTHDTHPHRTPTPHITHRTSTPHPPTSHTTYSIHCSITNENYFALTFLGNPRTPECCLLH